MDSLPLSAEVMSHPLAIVQHRTARDYPVGPRLFACGRCSEGLINEPASLTLIAQAVQTHLETATACRGEVP